MPYPSDIGVENSSNSSNSSTGSNGSNSNQMLNSGNGIKIDNNYQTYQMKFCSPKRKRATGPPSSKKTSMLVEKGNKLHLSFDLKTTRNPSDELPCYEDPLDSSADSGDSLNSNSNSRNRQIFASGK